MTTMGKAWIWGLFHSRLESSEKNTAYAFSVWEC